MFSLVCEGSKSIFYPGLRFCFRSSHLIAIIWSYPSTNAYGKLFSISLLFITSLVMNINSYFCHFPQPTLRLSPSPTQEPTISPTFRPSTSPTKSPTASPTSRPTDLPTASPSLSPTKSPTTNPSLSPTSFPTSQPTNQPTNHPTNHPTSQPLPTYYPSYSPSDPPMGSHCGNSVCNANEDPATCPYDCVMNILGSNTQGTDANDRGLMFTIEANARSSVTISSFDVIGRRNIQGKCTVYTRAGDYKGHEEDGSEWDVIFDKKSVVMKRGGRSKLGALDQEVTIMSGSVQSFYIFCNRGILYAKGDSEGSPSDQDGSLIVKEGVTTRRLFERVGGVAKFSGWIRYALLLLLFRSSCIYYW